MKSKILTIAVLFAVMVAMTGIAAASPFYVQVVRNGVHTPIGSPEPISPGTTQKYSLHFTSILEPNNLNANIDINICNLEKGSKGSGIVPSGITVVCTTPVNPGGSADFFVDDGVTITSSTGSDLGLFYLNIGGDTIIPNPNPEKVLVDDGTGGNYFNNIPEFSTIALPVAGALGLVFFFQQRKKKEE